jgi:hypothetical protein
MSQFSVLLNLEVIFRGFKDRFSNPIRESPFVLERNQPKLREVSIEVTVGGVARSRVTTHRSTLSGVVLLLA